MKHPYASLCAAAAFSFLAAPVLAQTVTAVEVASGLNLPLDFVQDPSQSDVQMIVQQDGHIRVLKDGVVQMADFLDVSLLTAASGEQGLLGLAFAPDYVTSHRFYINYTDLNGNTVVSRYLRSSGNPLAADPSTRFDLVWPDGHAFILQPFVNHNGGNLMFGPDGFLYIGMGDGGSENDPGNRAQDPTTLLGKMLRIDVSGNDAHGYTVPATNPYVHTSGVLSEIWDFGLRNPWRYSFDDPARGGTGALIIGDVGQDMWEEIDYEPVGDGGRNYGWSLREGSHPDVVNAVPFSMPLTDPIYEYSHAVGHTITGGFVYHGSALGAAFQGRYFFADSSDGKIWSLGLSIGMDGNATPTDLQEYTNDVGDARFGPVSFGVDASGELYVTNIFEGEVWKLVPGSSCTTPDPFTSLGGGTCQNGGWLPPGFGSGATPPPPPPPPPPSGSCATPDPFTSLGGGTCVNGGWLPPGLGGGSTPPPPPPPPPPTTGCSTPDPFASLGGGTCVNGGWLPPGLSGGSTPPPPPPPAACTTPDPFSSIPGLHGMCVNGGWIPVVGG